MSAATECGKLSLAEYKKAMKDHEISFEGCLLPEEWGEYATVFSEIRHIGQMKPAEFYSQYDRDDPVIVELRMTAAELTKGAAGCLDDDDTETGWRKHVEYPAFTCFEQEIVCPKKTCLKRRWKPIFEARPNGREEAERLERRRRRRKLCQCTPLERSAIKGDDILKTFIHKHDEHARHESIHADLVDNLKKRNPDRVIGLRKTPTVEHFVSQINSRYSPFASEAAVYPFVVTEAKQANNSSATWGSIFRQTAFVIRSCLILQHNLVAETGGRHQCLVWSFSNIGEEWRLYAGILQGTKTRIFDLWHGTMLHPEGPLQLLLIIDYLCDWACDVYRETILACLTGGKPGDRNTRLTPTGTEISSQMSDRTRDASRASSLPLRASPITLPGTRAPSLQPVDRTEELYEIGALLSSDLDASVSPEDTCHWRKWVPTGDDDLSPRPSTTVRHANHIELSCLRLIVPEDFRILQIFLQLCFPDVSYVNAAKALLTTLSDEEVTLATSLALVTRRRASPHDPSCHARIMVFSRSAFRSTDWQIMRQSIILFCSREAARSLAKVAGTAFAEHLWLTGHVLHTETIVEALNSFHSVGGTHSAGLALGKLPLCLRACAEVTAQHTCTWAEYRPLDQDAISANILSRAADQLASSNVHGIPDTAVPYIKIRTLSYIIPAGKSTDDRLFRHLGLPQFTCGGILIKKYEDWPERVPTFCFLVMDESVDFHEEKNVSNLLVIAQKNRERYGIRGVDAKYSREDGELIDRWIQALTRSPSSPSV